jgi:hypothetical protein
MRRTSILGILAAGLISGGAAATAGAQGLPDPRQLEESLPVPGASSDTSPAPATARASHGPKRFVTGIAGTDEFQSADSDLWYDRTVGLGAGIVRINVSWRSISSGEPDDPSDPADPAYDFSSLDKAVAGASARNLDILFTLFNAPDYGEEGGGKPAGSGLPDGAWKPQPSALGAFATALATRYSGTFNGLPRVSAFEPWNEANLNGFMAPQYKGKKLVSADRYRDLVIAVDKAVDSVHPDNRVVVGSLAPYGDVPGSDRSRPLVFLRDLLCLNDKLKKTKCPEKTPLDVLSHHPINSSGGPQRSAINDDDVSTPDMGNVAQVLRAAERQGTIAGKREHHPLWVTEYWWASGRNPEDPASSDLDTHARYVEESLYLFWKAGCEVAIYFTLVDDQADIGLWDRSGPAKPAASAFRFPFVTERKTRDKIFAWGKAPASGKLVIEKKAGKGWRELHHENVKAGNVFTADLRIQGNAKLRATLGDDHSLLWSQNG